jgi:anti-sigma factor RsiW
MAEKRTLHEEMLERVVAYYDGDLTAAEKAEFEVHLATCKECQHALRLAQMALPVAEDMLAFKPKHTIDEQVARFEAMWAEKRKAEAEAEARRTPRSGPLRLWMSLAAVAVALVIATVLWWRLAPTMVQRGQEVYMPEKPVVDGGGR